MLLFGLFVMLSAIFYKLASALYSEIQKWILTFWVYPRLLDFLVIKSNFHDEVPFSWKWFVDFLYNTSVE